MAHDHVVLVLAGGFMLIGKTFDPACDDCPAGVDTTREETGAIPLMAPAMLLPVTSGQHGYAIYPLPAPVMALYDDNMVAFQNIDGEPLATSYRALLAGITPAGPAPRLT